MNLLQLKSILAVMLFVLPGASRAFSAIEPRTIENPWINYANTSIIDIDKVVLTDSATILTVKATFEPKYWIRIVPETYLKANSKNHKMIRAEGMDPDKKFWMPESGKAEFTFYFEPLPFDTKTFDFIEGNEDGAFRIWDIDITGDEVAEYPIGLPSEFMKEGKADTVPDPVFEQGKTTVNFQFCPYLPELGNEFSMFVNTMSGEQEQYYLKFDSQGKASVSFDQYGSARAFVVNPSVGVYADLTLYPGETIDCFIDSRLSAAFTMGNNRETPKGVYKRSLHNGRFSDYDRAISNIRVVTPYRFNIYSGDFADYRMTGKEYKDHVKKNFDTKAEAIRKADIPQIEKDVHMLGLQNDVISAIVGYSSILERNYRSVKEDWESPVPIDSIRARLTTDDYKEVVGWIDLTNPKLLLIDNAIGYINWNEIGVPGDLSRSIEMYRTMGRKAKLQQLTEADLDSLRTLSNPFFAAACDSLAKRTARAAMELQKNAKVKPTPDVSDDKLFDAIIAPYKGKVVMVDLWNTWCGPCRAAIKQNEPLKTGELSSDDIVWIYIADVSSDPVKYLEMIQDIKGIHYKVNGEQIKAIRDRFKVDGIPYYILVDRQGKAEGRPDLRDHSRYIEAIKSKL